MIHEVGGDAGILQVLVDQLGVLLVDLLGRGRSSGGRRGLGFFALREGRGNDGTGSQRAGQQRAPGHGEAEVS